MKTLLSILALSVACHAQETNTTVTITLSPVDVWAVQRQINRPTIMRTNAPINTVSNYVVFILHSQIRNMTHMELQQFEWEERAKLSSAHPVIRAKIHDLLGVTNPPPALIAPPTP